MGQLKPSPSQHEKALWHFYDGSTWHRGCCASTVGGLDYTARVYNMWFMAKLYWHANIQDAKQQRQM